ncbi:MAG: hypothetical protein IPP29_23760 [Bacteroidetes bacterium]|nr:hypothetical protein [Bacteroidota bacterium]
MAMWAIGVEQPPGTTLDVRSATPIVTVGTATSTGGALYLGNANHGVQRGFPTMNADNNVGLMTASGNLYLSTNSNATGEFVLTDAGNVGIGTPSPFTRFNVRYDLTGSGGAIAQFDNLGNVNNSYNNGIHIRAGHSSSKGLLIYYAAFL